MGNAKCRQAVRPRRRLGWLAAAIVAVVLTGGGLWYAIRPDASAAGVSRDRYGDRIQTVEAGQVPVFATEAGPAAVDAYRFASSERGTVLEWVPCFCGCKNIGHRHNRDCYVKETRAGAVTFTSHGST